MSSRHAIALLLTGLGLFGDAPAAAAGLTLVDKTVRQFDPSAGEHVRFIVAVPPGSAALAATLHAPDGEPVRTLERKGRLGERVELVWDGLDEDGEIVPDEAYGLYLLAQDGEGKSLAELDLRETGEEPPGFATGQMNADLRLEATLERAARVQVRIGIESGPLLRTLVDWRPRLAGRFTVPWDGFDQSGSAYIADDRDLKILVSTLTLPPGTLLTYGRGTGVSTPVAPNRLDVSAVCSDALPRAVDVTVSRPDAAGPVTRGYEVAFYVDGAFVSEVERGYLPIRWRWDATGRLPGRHLLTVNLLQFGGDILLGSTSIDTAADCVPAGGG